MLLLWGSLEVVQAEVEEVLVEVVCELIFGLCLCAPTTGEIVTNPRQGNRME